jgi:uncharacterized protein (TIGR02246 family)
VRKTLVLNICLWLSIAIILVNLISCMDTASSKTTSSPQDIRAIVELAKNAWIARDADALAQLFTPNGELIVPGQRWQGQAKIRSEVAKFAQQYTDVKITIHRMIVEDNSRSVRVGEAFASAKASACAEMLCQRAAVEWHYEDTETATGKHNQADDAIVIEVQNGRISYWREYFDTSSK